MFESGGRRIKRTLRIDAASVRFLTDEEAGRLMRFRLLRDYLQAKTSDIAQANQHMGEQAAVPANRRRLTNIGTFRVYALAYLKQNPEVRQDMAMMVRMMEPQSDGIPVEVYCFTAVTAWVEYERIQGDIFDHLLAILPELGMRLYQQPSGADIGEMGGRLRESAMRKWAATASGRRGRNCHASPGRQPRPPHAIIFRSIVTYLETLSMSAARVGIAQINALVGDLAGNAAKVLEAARKAHAEGADVLVTPELVLTGYPPEDLLLRPLFVQTQQDVLDRLRQDLAGLAGLHVLVGHVQARQGRLYNAASVLCEGRVLGTYCKRELPNYSVFDEQRYFSAHGEALVFNVRACASASTSARTSGSTEPHAPPPGPAPRCCWCPMPRRTTPASRKSGWKWRVAAPARTATRSSTPTWWAARTSWCSMARPALDAAGEPAARLPDFTEGVNFVEVDAQGGVKPASAQPTWRRTAWKSRSGTRWCWACATTWARTVSRRHHRPVRRHRFGRGAGRGGGRHRRRQCARRHDAHALYRRHFPDRRRRHGAAAGRALRRHRHRPGRGRLRGPAGGAVRRPAGGRHRREHPGAGARHAADGPVQQDRPPGADHGQQVRDDHRLLHAVRRHGRRLRRHQDVPKTLVYRLAVWRNRDGEVIPERIITRPPSAELRPDQTDQDSLPPYDVLDGIMERYMEHNESAGEIVAAGYPPEAVEQVVRLIRINEYKRRQAPPGPRITPRAFGRDWRYPVTNGFREAIGK